MILISKKIKRCAALTASLCMLLSLTGLSVNAAWPASITVPVNKTGTTVTCSASFGVSAGLATTTCSTSQAFVEAEATYIYYSGATQYKTSARLSNSGSTVTASAKAAYFPTKDYLVEGRHYVAVGSDTMVVNTENYA